MNVLVVDVGGTHVKVLASGHRQPRKFASGPALTAKQMASEVQRLAGDWKYDVVSIGYPGPVLRDRPVAEPHHLGPGWVGFDFAKAFRRPVKVVNDALLQALGSYKGGKMLFLGLGTGFGSTLVVDGMAEPMELGHLPFKKGIYEDYVGTCALKKRGRKDGGETSLTWLRHLTAALEPDYVVLGGGNAKELKKLPPRCHAGKNANAFLGGFRLWEKEHKDGSTRRTSHY